jgi:hypothetical protein
MPIASNGFGPGAALLFLLGAPLLTAFSPKMRCPFQFVPLPAVRPTPGFRPFETVRVGGRRGRSPLARSATTKLEKLAVVARQPIPEATERLGQFRRRRSLLLVGPFPRLAEPSRHQVVDRLGAL